MMLLSLDIPHPDLSPAQKRMTFTQEAQNAFMSY